MWNRVLLHAWPVIELHPDEVRALVERVAPTTAGLGIELVRDTGTPARGRRIVRDRVLRFYAPTGHDVAVEVTDPPTEPLQPARRGRRGASARHVAAGTLHPAEIVQAARPRRSSPPASRRASSSSTN